jgi:hypothetical protein
VSRAVHTLSNAVTNLMTRFRIRITSGPYTGRYVGLNSSDAVVSTPELPAVRGVKIPGTRYSLYEQKPAATEFLQRDGEATQLQLKNLDYDSELDAVEVLDSLMGLSLSAQNIEERILRTCKYKFKEPDVHCVRLFFGVSHNAIDLIVEKDTTVQVLKEALGQVRAKGYERITRGDVELV